MSALSKSQWHVDVAVGETFTLELPETAGTGFRWHLDTQLEVVGSEFAPPGGAKVGGAGVRRFTLKAAAAGRYDVRAVLRRAWLGDASRVEEYTATVDAK
jgi:predicted secreted protein